VSQAAYLFSAFRSRLKSGSKSLVLTLSCSCIRRD